MSKPIKTAQDINNIATISSNSDEEIGNILEEVYKKLGKNLTAVVEHSNEQKITNEIIKGIYFKNGFKY